MNVEILLVLDTLAQGISVKRSAIPHPDFGMDLISVWKIGEWSVVQYYYGSVTYEVLTKQHHKTATY